jgi:hypothetical protein
MANDPPTNLRMGFGAKDAVRSGIRGFRVKSTSQLNASVAWEREQEEIRQIVKEHPELGDLVREIVARQTERRLWCTTVILDALLTRLKNK